MAETLGLADPRYVATQYRAAANLQARIVVHQRFSTNAYGWCRQKESQRLGGVFTITKDSGLFEARDPWPTTTGHPGTSPG